jgi:hypothetical protein
MTYAKLFSEGKSRLMNKKILIIAGTLSLCVVFAAVQYAAPVYGDDSLPAEVTIVSPSAESYGARVIVSSQVFLRWFALGEPDVEGARMLRKGWVDIELEDRVTDCSEVSIWARKAGWGVASFTVYISADGNTWTHIGGGKCTSTSYSQYDFSGDFGDVKYIKVKRNGWGRWSVMMLDAVMAERW